MSAFRNIFFVTMIAGCCLLGLVYFGPADDREQNTAVPPSETRTEESPAGSDTQGVETMARSAEPEQDSARKEGVVPVSAEEGAAAFKATLKPLAGLLPEEQQTANEEANAYVLPYAVYEGDPDVGDGVSSSGGRRFPPEKQAELEQEEAVVRAVRLNKIGLARLNARRAEQGLTPLVAGRDLNVAPAGKDLVAEPRGADLPKSGGSVKAGGTESGEALEATPDIIEIPLQGGAGGIVDNSALQYFPPIRDQGSVDSCVGWSEIYYATTHELAMAYGWDAKNGGDDYRLSPMFTYNF